MQQILEMVAQILYNRTRPVKNESTAQMRLILDLKKGGRFSNNSDFVSYLQHELNSRLTGGTAIIKELELAEPIGSPRKGYFKK
jgi:hypothetical protein